MKGRGNQSSGGLGDIRHLGLSKTNKSMLLLG
nr:MAG TPA: hypothetical protein [Caudoviricetes sp.]